MRLRIKGSWACDALSLYSMVPSTSKGRSAVIFRVKQSENYRPAGTTRPEHSVTPQKTWILCFFSLTILTFKFRASSFVFETIVEKLTHSADKITLSHTRRVFSGCHTRHSISLMLQSDNIPLPMLFATKVLLAISSGQMYYLLQKLPLLIIDGRTSTIMWIQARKMAPTWNFIFEVRNFYGRFVISRRNYACSVSKLAIKSKNNCVYDKRNVLKFVLFVTEF
jgi:hypothetical protein